MIHSLAGGGAERVMAGLASALSERNHQVTLITLDDGRQDRYELAAAVQRASLDVMGTSCGVLAALRNNSRRMMRLRQAIQTSRPDVVLSFCDRNNVLTLLATRGLRVPVVISEHSNPAAQRLPRPWEWLRRQIYRRASAVVVLTRAAAQTVAPWAAQPPIEIPLGVQPPPGLERSMADNGDATTVRTLVAVGRLEIEKGFDQLLQAFALVAQLHPQWNLVIHGEGSCRESLEQQCRQLGIAERVGFPGWTRPIWPALQSSDLFVLPSRYEGFPTALLEAMAAGLPCVAFDCSHGPAVMIRHEVDGLLVPSGEITALAAALQRCMSDAALRATLGSRASEVTQRFGWQAMVDAYEHVLKSQCH